MQPNNNYSAWSTPQYTHTQFSALSPTERLRYFCQLAHLAPSTHNTQPWKFHIDPDNMVIEVSLDQNSVLPASDVAGRQSIISIGAAIEHIRIGAEYEGYAVTIHSASADKTSVRPVPKDPQHVSRVPIATIALSPQMNAPSHAESGRAGAIFSRKIMRAEYKRDQPIPNHVLEEIQSCVDTDTITFHTLTDPLRRQAIAEFQAQADGFVINNKKFSRELGDWLLENDTSSPVGMPGAGFGLDDTQAMRMHRALSGDIPLEPEDGLRFSLAGKEYIEKTPFIGVITTKGDTVDDWIHAGRAFERIALTFESHGISHAMHAGIVEVRLINRMFAATLGTLQSLQVLFRAGYVKKEEDLRRPHSPRLPLEAVLY